MAGFHASKFSWSHRSVFLKDFSVNECCDNVSKDERHAWSNASNGTVEFSASSVPVKIKENRLGLTFKIRVSVFEVEWLIQLKFILILCVTSLAGSKFWPLHDDWWCSKSTDFNLFWLSIYKCKLITITTWNLKSFWGQHSRLSSQDSKLATHRPDASTQVLAKLK